MTKVKRAPPSLVPTLPRPEKVPYKRAALLKEEKKRKHNKDTARRKVIVSSFPLGRAPIVRWPYCSAGGRCQRATHAAAGARRVRAFGTVGFWGLRVLLTRRPLLRGPASRPRRVAPLAVAGRYEVRGRSQLGLIATGAADGDRRARQALPGSSSVTHSTRRYQVCRQVQRECSFPLTHSAKVGAVLLFRARC